jgi:glycosyl transferase family 25
MSFINKIVDKVYVINLEKDKERLEYITTQLKAQDIEFERFEAVDGTKIKDDIRLTSQCNTTCPDGLKGCAISHRTLWETMIEKDYKNILILEDDAILNSNLNSELQLSWNEVPNDFDILYLGSTFYCGDTSSYNKIVTKLTNRKIENISENILKTEGCGGLYGYIISQSGARNLTKEPIGFHVDDFINGQVQKYSLNAYAFHPVLIEANNKKSNLSQYYPPFLSSILSNIHITDQKNNQSLNWLVKESFLQVGSLPICSLMFLVFAVCFFIPLKYYFLVYMWLLVELFISKDIKNTLVYFFIIVIPYIIKLSL